MDFNTYQLRTAETAIYGKSPRIVDGDKDIEYVLLKLAGESAECGEVWGKFLRDNTRLDDVRDRLRKELGDVLWYVSQCATELDLNLNDIAHANLEKLGKRKERGTLGGSGEER